MLKGGETEVRTGAKEFVCVDENGEGDVDAMTDKTRWTGG